MDEFFVQCPEDGDYNQYWYSKKTIQYIVDELINIGGSIAFLSTPSIYFSCPEDLRSNSKVFDFDRKWSTDSGYMFYDFNQPKNISPELLNAFDIVVIDPPFITREVWNNYAITARMLMKEGYGEDGSPRGKVIGTTVSENSDFLREMLNLSSTVYQPSIPNLVYQYNLFTNYQSQHFSYRNPEIPE